MKPDAKRAAPLANARLELAPFPDRDGQHDKDGSLGTDPTCEHCGGTGWIEGDPERGMEPGEIHFPRDPCGCGEPPGLSEWMDQLLADIADAPSLRVLGNMLARRGAFLLSSLDQLEGQIRRGEVDAATRETIALGLWESDPDAE